MRRLWPVVKEVAWLPRTEFLSGPGPYRGILCHLSFGTKFLFCLSNFTSGRFTPEVQHGSTFRVGSPWVPSRPSATV